MSYTFDGPNRLIILDPGVTSITAIDVYSRWKDWAVLSDNAKYLPAFENSIGGNNVGGGVTLNGYFFISNGWKIRPQEADHELTVVGDLYPFPDTADVFEETLGNFKVAIALQRSSATLVTQGSVAGNVLAQAVWDYLRANPTTAGSMKEMIEDIDNLTKLIP